MNDLYEMGWNDLVGNLRRASKTTSKEKKAFARKTIARKINLPRYEPSYIKGTIAAARAFLKGENTPFKGPQEVIDDMELKARC